MKANVTLVNSDWTGEHVSRFLGITTRTLYPPVADPGPGLPWGQRRNAFLALGRISPEKEYERVMTILARVRQQSPDLTLTIVGTSDRHSRRYLESLTSLAASLGSWIHFRDNLTRDEVRALMAEHRYGIHGMREEHFGMAPAEMARAGAIVWVPRGGGQMEIVGREGALMYESDQDAVEKIRQRWRARRNSSACAILLPSSVSNSRPIDSLRRFAPSSTTSKIECAINP
jgi:glycosyltransferase involved in cell wall biosynthesis